MSARCCRQTTPRPGSTTSPTCLASRRRSSRDTWPRPRGSAGSPIGDPSIGLDRTVYRVAGDLSQDAHVEGLPLGTRGGIIIRHTFPLDAEYDLQVGQAGGARLGGPPTAGPRADDLYVALDGTRITIQGGRGATRLRIPAGPHTIAAAPVVRTRTAGADGIFHVEPRTPGMTQVTIAGPHNATGPGDTPSRRRLMTCTPASAAEEQPCAAKILTHARDACVSPAGTEQRRRDEDAARVLRCRTQGGHVRVRHPARACRACSWIRSSSSASSANPPPSQRARRSG